MRLMYFLSTNTSFYGMSTIINFSYLTITLKRSIQDISFLTAILGLVRSFKPLFGIIVDTNHIRGLQFTPYIFICSGVHFFSCTVIALGASSFGVLCLIQVIITVCIGFLDVIGEGLVALNTKLEYQTIELEIMLVKRNRKKDAEGKKISKGIA